MSNLTARAEQALIGAMLADQPLPAELGHLQADSFGHRIFAQIYTAILDLRDQHRGDDLTMQVAARVNQPGVDARWLTELRQTCPSTAHIASYARMVQVSAFRRTMAQHAERITKSTTGEHPDDDTSLEIGGMAQALNNQAQAYQAFTVVDDQQALHVWHTQPQVADPVTMTERATREEQVLADLFAHPEHTTTVATFVIPGTFTSQQRRDVFNTLVALAAQRDPVDELIVLWEMQRLRAETDLTGVDPNQNEHQDRTEPDAAHIARLATMTVAAGAAITLGHELIIEDIRQQLQHSATAALGRSAAAGVDVSPQMTAGVQLDPSLLPPMSAQPGQPTIEM